MPEAAGMFQRPFPYFCKSFKFNKFANSGFFGSRLDSNRGTYLNTGGIQRTARYKSTLLKSLPGNRRTKLSSPDQKA